MPQDAFGGIGSRRECASDEERSRDLHDLGGLWGIEGVLLQRSMHFVDLYVYAHSIMCMPIMELTAPSLSISIVLRSAVYYHKSDPISRAHKHILAAVGHHIL